ncbi:MAG: amidohydrolase family protein [Nitrospiraceae bacterium]
MSFVLRKVRIVDGCGQVIDRGRLVVQNDRITAVGSEKHVSVPRGTPTIDLPNMTVLPGLIDCHVHLCLGGDADVVRVVQEEEPSLTLLKAAGFAQQTLDAGFTTVRDLGFRDHTIFTLKQAIESGALPGPRILAAGLAICTVGGHASFIGREVENPQAVVRAVQEQSARGAEVIKFIASGGVLTPGTNPDAPQMSPEELAAGVAEAHRAGLRVAAHAHSAEGMKNAIRAGADSIEHATLMDDEASALMRHHGVHMVPTLSALGNAAGCGLSSGIPDEVLQKAQALMARHKSSFKKALRTGIPVAMGTDAGTPFNYHGQNAQELERMVALGMSPMEAIIAATASAARLLGINRVVGTLERGKQADLLIIEGNPLKKIAMLQERDRICGVVKGGKFVSGSLALEND